MGRGPTHAGSQEEGAFTHGLFQARGRHCRHCLRTLSWEHLNPGEAVRPEGHYLALGCHRVAVPAPQSGSRPDRRQDINTGLAPTVVLPANSALAWNPLGAEIRSRTRGARQLM